MRYGPMAMFWTRSDSSPAIWLLCSLTLLGKGFSVSWYALNLALRIPGMLRRPATRIVNQRTTIWKILTVFGVDYELNSFSWQWRCLSKRPSEAQDLSVTCLLRMSCFYDFLILLKMSFLSVVKLTGRDLQTIQNASGNHTPEDSLSGLGKLVLCLRNLSQLQGMKARIGKTMLQILSWL